MNFVLTSAGITNKSIANAVVDLSGQKKSDIKLVFIPTAANVEEGDKDWLINDLIHFKEQGYASIDIVDIVALPREKWQPRIEAANVICVGGGDEQYLVHEMRQTGFVDILPELLKTRLYIGISAGSMIIGKLLQGEALWNIYPEDRKNQEGEKGLEFIKFFLIPHFNSPHFPNKRKEVIEKVGNMIDNKLYALDDQSALKIVNDQIEVISGGDVLVVNE